MEGFWVAFLQFSRSATLDPFHFFGARFIKVFGKTLKFLRVFLTKFWVCSRKISGACFLGGVLHFCWQNFDIWSTIFGGLLEFFRLFGKVWKLVRLGRRPQRRPVRGRSPLGKDRPRFALHEVHCPCPAPRRRHSSFPVSSSFGASNREGSVAGRPQRRRGDSQRLVEAASTWCPARAMRSCSARGRLLSSCQAQ